MAAVTDAFNLRQGTNQSAAEFKTQVHKVYKRIETLKVDMSQMEPVAFLLGLQPKYRSLVDTLSITGDIKTIDEIFEQVKNFDERNDHHKDDASARSLRRARKKSAQSDSSDNEGGV